MTERQYRAFEWAGSASSIYLFVLLVWFAPGWPAITGMLALVAIEFGCFAKKEREAQQGEGEGP